MSPLDAIIASCGLAFAGAVYNAETLVASGSSLEDAVLRTGKEWELSGLQESALYEVLELRKIEQGVSV
jgi:hypothetical protein